MTKWNSVARTKSLKIWRNILSVLIGIGILVVMSLFCGCTRTQYEYKEIEREPIDCDMHIETPLDLAKCIAEFRQKY